MEYSLEDFFKKDSKYKKIINNYIKDYIKQRNIDTVREFNGIEAEQEFYITDAEIVIYFQPYVYTVRTYGPLIIPIPFEKIEKSINREYTELFLGSKNNKEESR